MMHNFKFGRSFKSMDEYRSIIKYLAENYPGRGYVNIDEYTVVTVPTVEDETIFRLRFG